MRRVLLASALALIAAASAQAAVPTAEVRDARGALVARAEGGPFAYPADAGLVAIGGSEEVDGRAVLHDVALLGGRIRAARIEIPAHGVRGASVDGLIVDGVSGQVRANTLRLLGGGGYVVALQQAVVPGRVGLVGLRVHLGEPAGGLPAGAELLVGLPPSPRRDRGAAASLLAFRVGRLPFLAPAGGLGYAYPLAARGPLIGCPFGIGSTHSPMSWPFNLESDNAVDLSVPVATPVLAVADGTIGTRIGALGSDDPRMAGLRVHLEAAGQSYYYAHLSRIDVDPGQRVVAGEQIGLSGSANGAAHLHFAQRWGSPAATIGRPSECGVYVAYDEPW